MMEHQYWNFKGTTSKYPILPRVVFPLSGNRPSDGSGVSENS